MNSSSPFEIRFLSPEETIPLRHLVLRPHQPKEQCQYEDDHAETTFHLGALDASQRVIGISTVLKDREDRFGEFDSQEQMRLRGMAVAPEWQGQGIGQSILQACLENAQHKGCEVFWCNARDVAVNFYANCGFQVLNETPFEIEGIGPHHVVYKNLSDFTPE